MNTIPEKTKALVLEAYNTNLIRAMRALKLTELEIPKPKAGEVLVKIEAAPVNPSDIAFLMGGYNIEKQLPATPGFEGSGTIVQTGHGVDQKLLDQRVCFYTQVDHGGTWAEYSIVPEKNCLPLIDELPKEQAACMFVNPLTAYGLTEHVFENRHSAVILSAANGQVGSFVRFFCREKQIQVINLVRKEKHVKELHERGEEFVLNTTFEDFTDALQRMATDLNATAAIDAVGGDFTGKLINQMPAGSEVILYGGLSGMPVSAIDPLHIIFKNKVLGGFTLGDWLQEKSKEELGKIAKYIELLFLEEKLKTQIQAVYQLDDFYQGIRKYVSDMSGGKVLLKP